MDPSSLLKSEIIMIPKNLQDLKKELDHLFIYDGESDVFQEVDFESFNESFDNSKLMETHSLDLITYEIGFEE